MASRKLVVEIVGDTRDLEKSFKQVEGHTSRFGSGLKKAMLPAVAALGGLAVGAKKSIDAASDLAESQNAVRVVFGKSAREIEAFSKVAATEAGLSMRELNELVTPLGASFRNMGDSTDLAAKKSIALAKRAADMASVFNVDVKDALGAIQAGLRGEADPLERFGVGLNASAVAARALEMGLAKSTAQLTQGDKAQARYALLLEQTNRVSGDFKNTSDGLANSQRIAKAQFENLSAQLGQVLIPVANRVMQTIMDVIAVFSGTGGASDAVTKVRGKFGDFVGFVQNSVLPRIRELWEFVNANIVPVFRQLGDVVVKTWQAIAKVLKDNEQEINGILRGMKTLIGAVVEILQFLAEKVVIPILKPLFTTILPIALGFTIDALGFLFAAADKVRDILVWMREKGGAAIAAFKSAADGPLEAVKEAVDAVVTSFEKIVDALKWLRDNVGGILGTVGGVLGKLPGVGDVAAGWQSGIADAMRPRYGAAGLQPSTANLLGQIQSMFGNVLVTSGFRTPEQNAAVQGAPNSDHLTGRAFDLVPASGWNAATIALFDRIAAFAAGLDAVRWIGWRGVPGHGPGDHLHISTFERGGTVPGVGPQLAIVHGGETITPRGQTGPITLQVMLDRRVIAEALYDPLRNVNQRRALSGGGGF